VNRRDRRQRGKWQAAARKANERAEASRFVNERLNAHCQMLRKEIERLQRRIRLGAWWYRAIRWAYRQTIGRVV
jgi:hypothetical protein